MITQLKLDGLTGTFVFDKGDNFDDDKYEEKGDNFDFYCGPEEFDKYDGNHLSDTFSCNESLKELFKGDRISIGVAENLHTAYFKPGTTKEQRWEAIKAKLISVGAVQFEPTPKPELKTLRDARNAELEEESDYD